jgi:hypothetical protein
VVGQGLHFVARLEGNGAPKLAARHFLRGCNQGLQRAHQVVHPGDDDRSGHDETQE